jgi:uncharacterized protein with ParB-like and HNH nuclease domain
MNNKIEIKSVSDLLSIKKLNIPSYQRPYKWSTKNLSELFDDIDEAMTKQREKRISDFKYRIGTILLHNNEESNTFDVIDGQQRIISLLLLMKYLKKCNFIQMNLDDKTTQFNLYTNYAFIKDWFALKDDKYKQEILDAFSSLLEVVVITVDKLGEAFQLFDSQNSRGKSLYPHDLLKAYHLREMNDDLFEMKRVVENWERWDIVNNDCNDIENLFDSYLFPIINWSENKSTHPFTTDDIDIFKGVKLTEAYPYVLRTMKAMPVYQITEPFIAGKDFFMMVDYYLALLKHLKINALKDFEDLNSIIENRAYNGTGFENCKELFYCSLLCYYDRFKNLDIKVIKKLFSWAFMIRVDMMTLSYSTINKYAIGGEYGHIRYTNKIPFFYHIVHAVKPNQISNININVMRENNSAQKDKWNPLYQDIKELNGIQR